MKKKYTFKTEYEETLISVQDVLFTEPNLDEQTVQEKIAYFSLTGIPQVAVSKMSAKGENGENYKLLSSVEDFSCIKTAGYETVKAKVFSFTSREAEIFSVVQEIALTKNAVAEAKLLNVLCEKYKLKQEQVASLTGKSRSAVANTMRLLTLDERVLQMIESGELSAGHARALIKAPQEKQFAFATETVKKKASVRQTERAIRSLLVPSEVLERKKQENMDKQTEEMKETVELMKSAFGLKVSMIGSTKEGRITLDYFTPEELSRFRSAVAFLKDNYTETVQTEIEIPEN